MTRKPRPDPLPHPAPEELRLIQEFLNTLDLETKRDVLSSVEDLNQWLKKCNLLPEHEALSEEEWGNALKVRAGLREWIQSHRRGCRVKSKTLAALNQVTSAMDLRYRLRVEPDGSTWLVCQSDGWPGVLMRLFEPLLEAMQDGSFRRLKVCAEETCARVFYDASRNYTGKWCNGLRCGNRLSTRAYRRRLRRGMPRI